MQANVLDMDTVLYYIVGVAVAIVALYVIAVYLKRLGRKPADSVEALERENPSLVKKWRSLAVFPAPFDRQAAEAVAEFEGDELDTLVGRSLVIYDRDQERFRLHDLMRERAEDGWDEHEAHQARRRHAAHYLVVEERAGDTYLEGGEGVPVGLRLFDRERVQIEAGQAWAASHAAENNEAAVLAQDYPLGAPSVLMLRQHPRERIRWLEASAKAGHKLGHRADEGMALGNLGNAYSDLGETRRDLGETRRDLGETRRAIDYYEQHLEIARETGDRRGEGTALGNLGFAYKILGETRRAIEYYEQALEIKRETGDRHGEGTTLGNLGNAYAALGVTQVAIEYYEQHLEIARETGDRRGEGRALWNRALALDKLGRRGEAIADAQLSLKIHDETEDPWGDKVRQALADWGAPPD